MIRTPLAKLAIVLGVVLVLDLGATAAVYVDRRDDPLVPEFTRADLSRVDWTVDTYRDPAPVLGLDTDVPSPARVSSSGRVVYPDGRVRPDPALRFALGALASIPRVRRRCVASARFSGRRPGAPDDAERVRATSISLLRCLRQGHLWSLVRGRDPRVDAQYPGPLVRGVRR